MGINFQLDSQDMLQVIAEGLQKRFERELYAIMRKDLDAQLKLFEAQGDEYIRKAAIAAAKAYTAQVHSFRDHKGFGEPKTVLVLNRKEVQLDGA